MRRAAGRRASRLQAHGSSNPAYPPPETVVLDPKHGLTGRAYPADHRAAARVPLAGLDRLPLGALAARPPTGAVAVGAHGQGPAGVAEPDRDDAVLGMTAALRQRLALGVLARGIVVGPPMRPVGGRVGDGAVVFLGLAGLLRLLGRARADA